MIFAMVKQQPFAFTRCVIALLSLIGLTVGVSGCVTNTEGGNPDGWEEILPAKVPELAALVPANIAQRGSISIGTNPPFAPLEFKDSHGAIIGVEIDLARAAASVLGLKLNVNQQDFTLILPSVTAGTVDFGASGFTDTEERRKNYDFVDYLDAGIQWAAPADKTVNPDAACGLRIAVQRGTVSDTDDVTAKDEACRASGKPGIEKLQYDTSDNAATAVVLGRADALSADSPVTAWAITKSKGRLMEAGAMFDAAPYGWPVPKGSPLAPALAAALQHLIDTGVYDQILKMWGIDEGLYPQAKINGEVVNNTATLVSATH